MLVQRAQPQGKVKITQACFQCIFSANRLLLKLGTRGMNYTCLPTYWDHIKYCHQSSHNFLKLNSLSTRKCTQCLHVYRSYTSKILPQGIAFAFSSEAKHHFALDIIIATL